MSSQGRRAVARPQDGEVLERRTQSGLIIVPFSDEGISSMVWGKMMERLLAGKRGVKSGVVITGTESTADRVRLVEGRHGSEVRLLPHPRDDGQEAEAKETRGEEWVSIHVPLERLEGMALIAEHRPRQSWLGPALASIIVLSGLVLGAAGARTLSSPTPVASAAQVDRGSRNHEPARPSVVVVKKQPVDRHAKTRPKKPRAVKASRARRVRKKRKARRRRVWRARRHLRVARHALRKGRRRLAKRRAVLALRLDPGNRAARWILSHTRRPPRPKPARAPHFIGERRGGQPVVW